MRRYGIWLAAATVSLLGTQVLGFAMAWVAAGRGGAFAGLVLTAINLPRVLLLLAGGAVADRVGAWRVMIVADVVMTAVMLAVAGAAVAWGEQPWLLVGAALAVGLVDAFYLPSSGSLPRLLVSGPGLARALSARHLAGQLVAAAGPPVGAVVVAAAGIAAAALGNAVTFALMALVLVGLRRSLPDLGRPASAAPAQAGGFWQQAVDGLRTAGRDRVLRPALLLTAAAAASLLPVSGLLVPLLARQRHWPAAAGGAVVGAVALGTAVVASIVLARGAARRPGAAAITGLLIAAGAVAALAVAPGVAVAIGAGLVVGVGAGLFSAHIAPLVLGAAPATHLARIQAVLVLVQSVPLLVTTNVLGGLADAGSVSVVLLVCASALGLAATVTAVRSDLPTAAGAADGSGGTVPTAGAGDGSGGAVPAGAEGGAGGGGAGQAAVGGRGGA
ncbi:MFS transporter [Actinoplanes sp. CA-051413]|uniref:MFS transporter n=1 Tax=Actinoplanes sp. CA-051413 TaxID=3239899 RepID=UPI003D9974C7